MSSTVEVVPARRHSRARFLVLIPLLPALAALAFVAIIPLAAVNADKVAQSLPATVEQPAAAPVQATPAITASPSPSAAAAEIFAAPPSRFFLRPRRRREVHRAPLGPRRQRGPLLAPTASRSSPSSSAPHTAA